MSTSGPEPESKSVRVLIVSDNPVSRIGFAALLDPVPHVAVAGGAPADRAPAAVRDHAPDVVLLDASPPHPGAVGRLARAAAAVRIVVVTATQDPHVLVQVLAAGAHGCLTYGHFEPADLADVLLAAGRGESSLSPPAVTALVRWLHDGTRRLPPDRQGPGLTAREAEILDLIAAGLTNRQIARRLVIAEKTVKNHAHQIYRRLGAAGREHAIARWRELRPAPAGGGADIP